MKILVTGCAGFIGHSVVKSLMEKKNKIIGLDNLNNYYSKKLKINRLEDIEKHNYKKNYFKFFKLNLDNFKKIETIFKKYKFDTIIHLAAQAGVRYSITNPRAYLKSNIIGFFNILELSRIYRIKHLIYASTGSVYGENLLPFTEKTNSDKPIKLSFCYFFNVYMFGVYPNYLFHI